VLAGLRALTRTVIADLAARDPLAAKIWASYRLFLNQARAWQRVSEQAQLATTAL